VVPRDVSSATGFGASLTLVGRDSVLTFFRAERDGASGSPEPL